MRKSAKKSAAKIKEFNSIKMHNMFFKVGEVVKVREYKDDECFGTILKIYTEESHPDAYIRLKWFYKPCDVFSVQQDFISQYELFESDQIQDIYVQSIYDKVRILSLEEYHALDEVDDDVYFTRAQYLHREQTLVPPPETWKRVCLCQKILNPDIIYVRCDRCEELYHIECIGEEINEAEEWFCPPCRQN